MNSLRNRTTPRIPAIAILLLGAALLAHGQDPKHVNHAEALSAAVQKVAPEYSPMARQLKLAGTVEVSAYIGEDGKVEKVVAVSGNPILFHCAEDALKKWRFSPFLQDGKAIKAVAAMNFSFKL